MTDDHIPELLRGLRFLQDAQPGDISRLAAVSRSLQLPAGDLVFREGDPSQDIFLVHCGRVALEICAPSVGCKRIMTASDGELLGWSPLLGGTNLTATARTLTNTQLVAMDASRLLAIFEEHPRLGYHFMRCTALAMAQRLNATRMQLLDVFGAQLAQTGPPLPKSQGGTS